MRSSIVLLRAWERTSRQDIGCSDGQARLEVELSEKVTYLDRNQERSAIRDQRVPSELVADEPQRQLLAQVTSADTFLIVSMYLHVYHINVVNIGVPQSNAWISEIVLFGGFPS